MENKTSSETETANDENTVLADSVCKECEKNIPMEGSDTCQWCALADM